MAAGDVMSDALVTAAENAPGTVQAAAGLIRSFAAGVSKNKKRIYSAAVDIAATLGNALADLLPKSISVPVKKAISSVQRSFESGGLKKAVTSATKFISAVGVVITNTAAARRTENKITTAQAVTDTKLDELTREVREHNDFARRVPVLEEQIKVANHRISDLEKLMEGK